MSDAPPPPTRRATRAAVWLLVAAWTLCAVIVLVVGIAHGHAHLHGHRVFYTIAFGAMVLIGANVSFDLSFGRARTTLSLDGPPILVAALLCGPLVAGIVALGTAADHAYLSSRIGRLKLIPITAASVVSALAAGEVANWIDKQAANPTLILPAAIVITLVYEIVLYASWATLYSTSGHAMHFLRSTRTVLVANLVVGTFALALVGPFHKLPVIAVAVLIAYQAVAWLISRLSTSESLQRRRSEYLSNVFSRYVPTTVARQLEARGEDVELGGEEREVTVMFCDVRGFTAWSEHEPPERVVAELNVLLAALSEAVMELEGTLDKFTGDGLMAFWGAPLDQPDHADRACAAAERMVTSLRTVNASRIARNQPPFAIGIGIHSGQAVVGNIGSDQRLDYTAIGDTVNLSARLESATKELDCIALISAATRKALHDTAYAAALDERGEVSVKGRQRPVQVFSIPVGSVVNTASAESIS